MGDYTQKDMTGALFKNERKQPGEDYPDYQGSITVKGVQYDIGAWLKKAKSGKNYMSISIRPPKSKAASQTVRSSPAGDFQDDDIPF